MSIKAVIEKIVKDTVVITVLPCTVTAIEGSFCTVVSDEDDREFFKVQLNALGDQKTDTLLVTPKAKSKVVIGVFQNGADAVLLSMSEVDSIYFKKDSTEFKADADGYKIDRNGQNLKEVLNDYIDEVNKIVVIQGQSINVAATLAIKERLNMILK